MYLKTAQIDQTEQDEQDKQTERLYAEVRQLASWIPEFDKGI